jgi:NADPH:quinone reductase-like Zn-dependent oxidoreductase
VRAVRFHRYGPPEVLRIEDVEKPVPKDDELLVRIHATTVNRTDTGFRSAEYFAARAVTGFFRPRKGILGNEFSGEVEAVGSAVSEFEAGDRVFGIKLGAQAEFVCVRESRVVAHMPEGMSFEEAAAVADGALTALSGLRKVELRAGRSILVYGASGSIGTASVQLARYFGAHVTAVCNTENVELVRSLGADEVIDYLQEDFTKSGKTYDVVFDAVGKESWRRCRGSLKTGGVFLDTDPGYVWHLPLVALWTRWVGDKKARLLIARLTKENLLFLKELIEAGEYRAVIDRRYPLEHVVEATRYVETGQKTGNVVVTVRGDPAGR